MGLWLSSDSFTSILIKPWIACSSIFVQVFIENPNYFGCSDLPQITIVSCPAWYFLLQSCELCYIIPACYPLLQIQGAHVCQGHMLMLRTFSLILSTKSSRVFLLKIIVFQEENVYIFSELIQTI